MVLNGLTDGWCLFLLAALIPRAHLQGNDSLVQTSRPRLSTAVDNPKTGSYSLTDQDGSACIKATVGAEYSVTAEMKTWYFNLNPSDVRVSGFCDKQAALLSLTLPDHAASLNFTFTKEKECVRAVNLTAHLYPQPVCKGCAIKKYSGHKKLFQDDCGQSFKCRNWHLQLDSSNLSIDLVHLQIQVFSENAAKHGKHGKEVECWNDLLYHTVIPLIIRAVVVGLTLTTLVSLLLLRERHRPGYERL